MAKSNWVYEPILNLIGYTEGTDKGDGYNETLSYGAYTGGDVNLITMNLGQIDALQTRMLSHPRNKWKSSAIGRYQIVRTTLRIIKSRMRLSDSVLFNAETQDAMARYLLWGRGIDRYCEGKLSEDALIEGLAKEWASLPKVDGKGAYGGQHAAVSPQKVREVLREVKRRYIAGETGKLSEQPVEPIKLDPVVVPVPVETAPYKEYDPTIRTIIELLNKVIELLKGLLK